MLKEIHAFFLHLRLPYNFFILSAPFLAGGFVATGSNLPLFLFQFVILHGFFYGGINAYNSYFDKDTGPIGGLKNPPPMESWMLPASIVLQLVAVVLAAFFGGPTLTGLYLLGMLASFLYSTPGMRWKGKSIISLIAVGASAGVGAFLVGFVSMGGGTVTLATASLLFGMALMMTSVYPLSQAYQVDEDKRRGDMTFSVRFGLKGIKKSFLLLYFPGLVLVFWYLFQFATIFATIFLCGSFALGLYSWFKMHRLPLTSSAYSFVMRIKYMTGISAAAFTLALLLLKQFNRG